MDDEIVSPELRQTDPTLDLKALPTGVNNEISSTALIDGGPSGTVSYDRELAKQVLRDAGGDLNKAAEALLARGFDMDGVLAFGEIALKDQDLIDDPDVGSYIAPPPALVPVPPMGGVDEFGNPVAPPPVYDSRFDNEQDAIQYAEENGQGKLTQGADGELYNRFGEKMVYDSSGNLAPAPRDIPVGMIADPNNPDGFIDDPNWINPDLPFVPPMGGVDEFGNPVAPPPVYDSRFDNEQDAIQYAEENGQGNLTPGADGELYNRFGEKMVYDSSGNLAPAPRDIPVGMIPDPNNPNEFFDDQNWIDPGYIPPPIEQIEYIPPPEPPMDFYF